MQHILSFLYDASTVSGTEYMKLDGHSCYSQAVRTQSLLEDRKGTNNDF